jgi:hypothetical protein
LGRILALSDGVFAIALTLLVLALEVPRDLSPDQLGHELARLHGDYLAYAVSVMVIGRFWILHHFAFRHIVRYDTTLLWLNLMLLALVAFLPFPTRVLGEHGDTSLAAVFYTVTLAVASTASGAVWWYASWKGRLLRPGIAPGVVRTARIRSASGPVFFLLTIPVAYASPLTAELLWLIGYPVVRFLVLRVDARRHQTAG